MIRSKHSNVGIHYKGALYMPSLGITGAGTTMQASLWADHIMRNVDWLNRGMAGDLGFVAKLMAGQGTVPPVDPKWRFTFHDIGGFGLIDHASGKGIRLMNNNSVAPI